MAPAFAKWKPEYADVDQNTILYFKNLKRHWVTHGNQEHNLPCCDVSDCHKVDYDIKGGHYRVLIDGEWVEVPDEASQGVSSDRPNPTGSAVACYVDANALEYPPEPQSMGSHYLFYCFVPGTGS